MAYLSHQVWLDAVYIAPLLAISIIGVAIHNFNVVLKSVACYSHWYTGLTGQLFLNIPSYTAVARYEHK